MFCVWLAAYCCIFVEEAGMETQVKILTQCTKLVWGSKVKQLGLFALKLISQKNIMNFFFLMNILQMVKTGLQDDYFFEVELSIDPLLRGSFML